MVMLCMFGCVAIIQNIAIAAIWQFPVCLVHRNWARHMAVSCVFGSPKLGQDGSSVDFGRIYSTLKDLQDHIQTI